MANNGIHQIVRQLYNQVYNILNIYNLIAKDDDDDDVHSHFAFTTLQRGLYYKEPELALVPELYPWAFVGQPYSTEVEGRRSPRVWTYEVTIPVTIMTFADRADQTELIFNDNLYDYEDVSGDKGTLEFFENLVANPYEEYNFRNNITYENKNPGAWDLADKVTGFFWDNYHTDRLGFASSGNVRSNVGDYTVEDWTYGIGTSDIPAVQVLTYHAYFIAVQVNFVFKVEKRDSLALINRG